MSHHNPQSSPFFSLIMIHQINCYSVFSVCLVTSYLKQSIQHSQGLPLFLYPLFLYPLCAILQNRRLVSSTDLEQQTQMILCRNCSMELQYWVGCSSVMTLVTSRGPLIIQQPDHGFSLHSKPQPHHFQKDPNQNTYPGANAASWKPFMLTSFQHITQLICSQLSTDP